jgi:hypothetical protein
VVKGERYLSFILISGSAHKQHTDSRCSGNIMTFDDRINGILSDASYPIGPIKTSDEKPVLEVRKTQQ